MTPRITEGLHAVDKKARCAKNKIASLPETTKRTPKRMGSYVKRLIEKILADLE